MLPLLLAALPGIADIGIGAYQQHQANQLAKKPFTPYKTPDAFMEYVNNAKSAAQSAKMPGQSRTEDLISAGVSNSVKAAQESGQSSDSILASVVGANANQNNALNVLGGQAAEFKQNNINRYQTALKDLSGQKDKEYETNIYKPYMAAMAASSALREAAGKNATKGLSNLSALGTLASGYNTNTTSKMSAGYDPTATTGGPLNAAWDSVAAQQESPITSSSAIDASQAEANNSFFQNKVQQLVDGGHSQEDAIKMVSGLMNFKQ